MSDREQRAPATSTRMATAFATHAVSRQQGRHHRDFVDADGDGVCDNYASGACPGCEGGADADGDGVCDNYGSNARGGCGRASDADNYGSGSGCGPARGHHGRGC